MEAMEAIGACDAKTRFCELLEHTANGETFEITKHGRLVGRLVPPEGVRDQKAVSEAISRLIARPGKFGSMTAEN